MRSVTIYGTGLIGGSFALALKRHYPGLTVFGVDTPAILARAQDLGLVERGEPEKADLVVLAAPVGEILKLLGSLPPGPQLVLDMGSTKVEICREAELRGLPFIGGHPMAGSERSGPDAASADLFRNAQFFLCPVRTTPEGGIQRIERLLEAIGALPAILSPEEHDRIVAQLSHLPQLLSTVLADHTSENRDFAGPGWKSVTRLAASPFHVWRDILVTSGFLPYELETFIQRLRSILDALESRDMDRIERVFERANRSFPEGLP
jgi:prephenate dehydrogenase